jgi:hypothetical protein
MKRLNSGNVMPTTTAAQRDYYAKLAEKYGCPLEAMFSIGSNDLLSPETRLRAMSEAAQYGMSKLKSVEMTGPDGGPLEAKLTLVDKLTTALDSLAAAQEAVDAIDQNKEEWKAD